MRARTDPIRLLRFFVAAGLLVAAAQCGKAEELRLAALFTDHMVLQRDASVPVWGWETPGGEVAVEVAGQVVRAVADADGSWRTTLAAMPMGGPHAMVVRGSETIRIEDVLIGDVWLASGQSNMEMPLAGWGRVLDYETEIARADYPEIRLFQVGRATAVRPLSDVSSDGWRRCSPEAVAEFSSTAYFFARRVHRETGVPIGIIHSSWGGTVAEAWTSAGALAGIEDFRQAVRALEAMTDDEVDGLRAAHERALAERNRAVAEDDKGKPASGGTWADPSLDDREWGTMDLPAKWEDVELPNLDGVVWFRRSIEVPESWVGGDLVLDLGPIDDADETFFNGVQIGATDQWDTPRSYPVPADLVRAGSNVIAVRVLDIWLGGGLWGEPGDLKLRGPGEAIPLAGPWAYRVGLELDPLPMSPDDPNQPTVLHNAMIRPLAPYAIRGAIWYQGESNSSRAWQYRTLFPTMIRDWRALWGQGDFPFYFVQLAAFDPGILEKNKWPELREAQLMALSLPETGMAVAIDIGNPRDVHPKNKQEVGNRLARLALKRVYGQDVVDSGPLFRGADREGAAMRIAFEHTAGGLEAKGGALRGFVIAGEDQTFHSAEAWIEDETVLVWSAEVPDPKAVRYGWEDAPDCNLYNAAGLPASPFRTDAWPSLTVGVK